jgi:hypothetical protein
LLHEQWLDRKKVHLEHQTGSQANHSYSRYTPSF